MALSVDIKDAFYGNKQVLTDIKFALKRSDILAIVGETGSGKTTLARIISGLHKFYNLTYDGLIETNLNISFIPQNTSEALDALFNIEYQMREIIDDIKLIKDTLLNVGFVDVDRVLNSYPHNLSGGMKQRVLIAMALLKGDILIADEFTSALDRNTKLQMVKLFKDVNKRLDKTIIFITHDLELLDFEGALLVMYKGKAVEYGDIHTIKSKPYHPYMQFLLKSLPSEGMHYTKDRFDELIVDNTSKCPFVKICAKAQDICWETQPDLIEKEGRYIRCHF